MSIETIREFLGWCTVIYFGVLTFAFIKVIFVGDWASKVHGRLFHIDDAWARKVKFQFFAVYSIAIIVFNLVPYIALRIMTAS